MNNFLKSRRLYMLFLLPFLVMAIAFVSSYLPGEHLQAVRVQGVIDLSFINRLDKFWGAVIGGAIVLGIAYLIFFISEKFKLLSQTTTLPSLIYVLLTSGMMVYMGFDYLLIAVLVMALALARLQEAIKDTKTNNSLYDFGCLVTLAVAVYPKFVFLLLWALCVLFFCGRSTLKDIVALWLGILTPVLFITFYYFWTDRLDQLIPIFTRNLMLGEYIHHLPAMEVVRLTILSAILLVALYQLSLRYSLLIVSQRRGILALVSMLIFLSLTFVVIPVDYYDFMYMFALPLAFLYAYYFISNRLILVGNVLFILLLAACLLTCWV